MGGTISESGTQSLAVNGPGTTILGGNNTYSGGTTVNSGTLLANNSGGSATGSGALTVAAGATLGGTGFINASSFAIGGSGSRTSLIVGNGTDTASGLTLTGSGSNTINNTTLSFNISAVTAGQANTLSVGASAIAFSGSSTLALNVSGVGIIPAYSPYVLIAGTGGDGTVAGSQYSGLDITNEVINGQSFAVINGLNLTFAPSLANTWYAGHSFLFLDTSSGVDDIEVEVVPEPGTWALMIGGLAALVFWQRRRKMNQT